MDIGGCQLGNEMLLALALPSYRRKQMLFAASSQSSKQEGTLARLLAIFAKRGCQQEKEVSGTPRQSEESFLIRFMQRYCPPPSLVGNIL